MQDGFHPTPTTALANLVLPAAMWGEKEGTFTNSERRVSKVNRAVNPPGEARSDFDIFLAVAAALGCREELFPGWTAPADAFDEWKRVSAGRLCDYSGMTYDALERDGGMQWPCPEGSTHGTAVRRLYADGVFQTDDGKARLIATEWEPFPEQPRPAFPLILNTGRTVEHWHTRRRPAVCRFSTGSPSAWVEVNRATRAMNVKPSDRVDVVSQRGRICNRASATETVAPGGFVPFHWASSTPTR